MFRRTGSRGIDLTNSPRAFARGGWIEEGRMICVLCRWILAVALVPVTAQGADTLPIDPSHSAVIFSWHHRGLSHPIARFEKVLGTVTLDPSDLTRSSVSVTLPVDGLRTADEVLDRRLRSAQFLDLGTYPVLTFKSTRVEAVGAGALKITGDLTVHGITRSVVLEARTNKILTPSKGKPSAGFDADARLLRSDFGVGRYVPMVGDELSVHITVEVHEPD
jgi:polyisoprenoid-binding protein YceI